MELKQLESYVAVIKHGSFTKAAEVLYVSQPTISTHINALERDLDTPLIIRTTKQIKITPKGQELYNCALSILELRDNLLDKWVQESSNEVIISSSTIPTTYLLPQILSGFYKKYPSIPFSVHQELSASVIEKITEGHVQVGFTGMKTDDELLDFVELTDDKMALVTPGSDEFKAYVGNPHAITEILTTYPLILRDKGSGSKEFVDYILTRLNIVPSKLSIMAHFNDPEGIKNLIAKGVGVAILSEVAIQRDSRTKSFRLFDLPKEFSTRKLYMVYRKHDAHSKNVQLFIDYVKTLKF